MNKFVIKPNFPEDAKCILISEKYSQILGKSLEKMGISPVYVPQNTCVDDRVSGHVDLSVFHGGGERIYLAPYLRGSALERRLALMGAEIIFPQIKQSAEYPNDSQLNLCAVGEYLFCCKNVSSTEIIKDFANRDIQLIQSRQGYCGCSICAVAEKAIICSDEGIASAAAKNGFDVLKIAPGFIKLDGYNYGFIGGASFKISKSAIAFTGLIDCHPDADRILDFLKKYLVQPIYLTELPLFDIGGAIPLMEN